MSFPDEMRPWLEEQGYAAVAPKDDTKGKRPDMAKTAIFYRRERFDALWEDHRSRIVLAALKHRSSGRVLYVASCHLEGAPPEAAVRFTQTRKALESLARHQAASGIDPTACSMVFAGDFNETEDGAVCRCLGSGGLPKDFRAPQFPEVEISKSDFAHPFGLSDLYAQGRGPWPRRPPTLCAPLDEGCGARAADAFTAIDFVFYSHRTLLPVAVRQPFSTEQVEATLGIGIPSAWHFSDHVPVGGIFKFVDADSLVADASRVSVL